jgi:hypothetical protein
MPKCHPPWSGPAGAKNVIRPGRARFGAVGAEIKAHRPQQVEGKFATAEAGTALLAGGPGNGGLVAGSSLLIFELARPADAPDNGDVGSAERQIDRCVGLSASDAKQLRGDQHRLSIATSLRPWPATCRSFWTKSAIGAHGSEAGAMGDHFRNSKRPPICEMRMLGRRGI